MLNEDFFLDLIKLRNKKTLMIMDRGTMDNFAYLLEGKEDVLKKLNTTISNLRDKRYDQVIHMVTAADGAEDFYNLQNNLARSENSELAKMLDKKIQDQWNGHHNYQ